MNMDSKLWKRFRNDLSFLVCSYMNNLVDSESIMYRIVKDYDDLFPEDNIFHFLNPDDKLTNMIDLFGEEEKVNPVEHPFDCLLLKKMPYFSLEQRNVKREWKWNYHRKQKEAFYSFLEDWITIVQAKFHNGEKDSIMKLLKIYERKKQDVLNKLNECVKDTFNLKQILV